MSLPISLHCFTCRLVVTLAFQKFLSTLDVSYYGRTDLVKLFLLEHGAARMRENLTLYSLSWLAPLVGYTMECNYVGWLTTVL